MILTTQNVLYLPHHFTRQVGLDVSSWHSLLCFFFLQFLLSSIAIPIE
jgi:hypothetical protein